MTRWLPAAYLAVVVLASGCPGGEEVKPDKKIDGPPVQDAAAGKPEEPEVEVTQRPVFDSGKPAPCESHTACYLQAKDAHDTGERAGYLLALEKCEFYRGRYQLEKFYGLCLLILADAYRHLNNFEESQACYQRFLDAQPDDEDLALQAREGIEEVKAGAKEPALYRDYLQAVSLLRQFNRVPNEDLIKLAEEILSGLRARRPEWTLSKKVKFLLEQIEGLMAAPDGEPGEGS
jgi:tetratricopeptide (TPR) repeat protein